MRILIMIVSCIALISDVSAQYKIVLKGNGSVLSDSLTASKQYTDSRDSVVIAAIGDTAYVLRSERDDSLNAIRTLISTTNTDEQTIDKFQLDGNTLKLSLENDGEADKEVDLSSLEGVSIYTENGALTGDRTVNLSNNILSIINGTTIFQRDLAEIYSPSDVLSSIFVIRNWDTSTAYSPSVLNFQARGTTVTNSTWMIGNTGLNSQYSEADFFIKNRTSANSYPERFRIKADGSVGIGTSTPDARLDVEGGNVRFSDYGAGTITGSEIYLLGVEADGDIVEVPERYVSPPASASSSCTAGEWSYDSSYYYICTGTNTWKRASVATW